MTYNKPLPEMDNWTRPFWEACQDERLTAQRCDKSGTIWFPPSPVSPVTRTSEWTWTDLSGRGTVWSFIEMHQLYFKGFADELPYNVVQIQLEEGPMFISNIVDCPNDKIKIGMQVHVVFEKVTDTVTLPKFAPGH